MDSDSDQDIELSAEDVEWATLLAYNEAYTELVDNYLARVEKALENNREEQVRAFDGVDLSKWSLFLVELVYFKLIFWLFLAYFWLIGASLA